MIRSRLLRLEIKVLISRHYKMVSFVLETIVLRWLTGCHYKRRIGIAHRGKLGASIIDKYVSSMFSVFDLWYVFYCDRAY